jgi:hypothetical protein
MRLLTEEALTEFLPTLLHEIAFVPFIRSQASPEQAQKWLPLAEQYVRAREIHLHLCTTFDVAKLTLSCLFRCVADHRCLCPDRAGYVPLLVWRVPCELQNFLVLHFLSLSLWAGHGSNVQGLETTATFVPETDEFELHTPTLTGSGPLRFFKC